jgi:hypothetical protein
VVGLFSRWEQKIADGIRSMQASGQIGSSMDAGRRAAALLAGLQGGVLIMLATGEIAHLEAALDEGIAALRRVPGAAQDGSGGPAGLDGRGGSAALDGGGA